jgi:hypothetical protein
MMLSPTWSALPFRWIVSEKKGSRSPAYHYLGISAILNSVFPVLRRIEELSESAYIMECYYYL